MGESVIQRAFAGGELAPVYHARADLARYTLGARTVRNWIVLKEGGVANRAGFRFVGEAKTATAGTRLRRFVVSSGSGFLLEFGSGYIRFFRDGGPVEVSGVPAYNGATAYVPGDLVSSGGTIYYAHAATTGNAPPNVSYWHALTGNTLEIPTPWSLTQIPRLSQSGNVATLTHVGVAPKELVYSSATRWVLRDITTAPTIQPPTAGLMGTAGAAGARTFRYVVTTAADPTYEESTKSATITVASAADPTEAAPIVLAWTAVTGAAEYYVYGDPFGNGVYGYLGAAATNGFNDTGFVPDFNVTPPLARTLFTTTNNFPGVASHYQQRRFFARTTNEPDSIYGSRIGFPSNFGISSPLQDDDSVTFRLAGNNHHAIRDMVALRAGLVLMTDGGEWTLTGGGGVKTPITPNSIDAEQETYVGVSESIPSVVVGNSIVYVQARGRIVRELRFDQAVEGLAGKDLSIFASHLFRRRTLVAMDYQLDEDSIVWAVRSDGVLLGLTYVPEQDVWGWHQHTTEGTFEDVCVVPEDDGDGVYVIVRRDIGATKRYIERLEPREIREGFFNADSFFVDSGLSYSGPAVGAIAGLDHLEGQVVAVLADGAVVYDGDPDGDEAESYRVASGQIDLPALAQNVHVGLAIRFADLETLDLDVSGVNVRDKEKRVQSVTLLVDRSASSVLAGTSEDNLQPFTPQAWEGSPNERTGQIEIPLEGTYEKTGRVFIRQRDPLPVTILGVIPNVTVGG